MDIAEFISRRLRTDADEMLRDFNVHYVTDMYGNTTRELLPDFKPVDDEWPDEIDS